MTTQHNTELFMGIDFGTSNSCMARFDPKANVARIIRNADGYHKTPSIVYYTDDDYFVGRNAEARLENPTDNGYVVTSIKRNLDNNSIRVFGKRRLKPVDIAADIIRKLREDAEKEFFYEPVTRAVITYPAVFIPTQKRRIEKAARQAGFSDVILLEEPVAAAIAYRQEGRHVEDYFLVYDLGGGTFDLAILEYDPYDRDFRPFIEPKGFANCGGDDFDLALYEYFEDQLQMPLSDDGDINKQFLSKCRDVKQSLTTQEFVKFSFMISIDGESRQQAFEIKRDRFNSLIEEMIDDTVVYTEKMLQTAQDRGTQIDTIVLIGGSSRIPIVQDKLQESLPDLQQLKWHEQDMAVALGAAYYAKRIWGVDLDTPELSNDLDVKTSSGESHKPKPEELERHMNELRYEMLTDSFMRDVGALLDNQMPAIVDEHMPNLLDRLSYTIAEGICNDLLKPSITAWRNKETWKRKSIVTLNDLETKLATEATKWPKRKHATRRISKEISEWLSDVIIDIKAETDKISRRYDIPLDALELDGSFDGNLSSEGINLSDPTYITNMLVVVIYGVIVAILIGLPGPGWIALLVGGPIALWFGDEISSSVQGWVKDRNMPIWMRKTTLSEEKIDQMVFDNLVNVASRIHEQLAEKDVADQIRNQIIDTLTEEAQQKAEAIRTQMV